jgi:transposase
MPRESILFAQIMRRLPLREFHRIVAKHRGEYKVKEFSCLDQFLAMSFAQLTFRSGLRSIEDTLRANAHCLYHMGFRCQTVSRNTLANANEVRPWQMYAEFALLLIERARDLYSGEPLAIDLDATVFALDSTTIDLCLKRFPWCPSQQSKAAVKLHTLLNLRGDIPEFVWISGGKTHDVKALDLIEVIAGAYYLMDRGYVDFSRLYRIHQARASFVTRAKRRMRFRVVTSRRVDKAMGFRCDQTIRLEGQRTKKTYPEYLRRIKYMDAETGKLLVFLSNDFALPELMIANLYQQRWRVELFFKWIKQHLKIKTFYGYSDNAVRTQLWIAVSVYVLLAIIKKELKIERDLHEILEILSASIFQETPISQALSRFKCEFDQPPNCNQLMLFDL